MIDDFIIEFDKALRTVFARAPSDRPAPGADLPEGELDDAERGHAAGLMRVNHCGEICAQALYQGQAITSHDPAICEALRQAAWEETEHLNWTERRIEELGGRKSFLNPVWYVGSVAMGLAAGWVGDRWNLGFLAETERQVEAHLLDHLGRLPVSDTKSRAILEQMKADEIRHAETAIRLGAAELPMPVRLGMRFASKLMTRTAYWV
ncbi:MAG: 2-polyprenyl-3-methyl-6-methoxy-1,4-benzoquinone monooxygenase [Sterolibacteriaceae bacterium MAG5]|nr:2-polyprenyl-3-methyl-6-methoxy-1,4-benzoquinone monooxygenase [Candidatus Nitricoxidireducens bremensis]